jgi:uncharacterized membrane protein
MSDQHSSNKSHFLAGLRTSFITGIIVIAPVGLTVWLLWTMAGWVDGFVFPFIPEAYAPENISNTLFGIEQNINVRGLGIVFFILFTTFVGWVAKGVFGRILIRWGESIVDQMPVIRSIYSGLKQIAETVFTQQERSFEQACMIEYPRRGIWAVGFITSEAKGEIQNMMNDDQDKLISVFVPTTPNPTSGFLLFFKESEIHVLDMSVEDAAKLVISAGLVYPQNKPTPAIEE